MTATRVTDTIVTVTVMAATGTEAEIGSDVIATEAETE